MSDARPFSFSILFISFTAFYKKCVHLSSSARAWPLPNWLPAHQRARGGSWQLTVARSLIAMTSYLALGKIYLPLVGS